MKDTMADLLYFAKQQALDAGTVMKRYFSDTSMQVSFKPDKSVVTQADITINEQLIRAVRESYPEHGVLGEEASHRADAKELWVCDPIDGTDAFVHGVPTAMFSLAYVVDGEPIIGVAYEPIQQLLFHAVAGKGAYMNDAPIKVSGQKSLRGASVMLISSLKEFLACKDMYQPLMDSGVQLRIVPGNVFKATLLARGKIDGYYFPGLKAHDVAATKLIVQEAGGMVTDLHGKPQRYNGEICGAIFSNGHIHDELVAGVETFGVDTFKGF